MQWQLFDGIEMKSSNWLWRINEGQCFLYFFRCQFSLLFTPQIGLKFRDRKKQFEQQHYSNGQHLIWRFPGGYWIVCPIALQKLELVVIGYVCLECEVKKKDDVGKQCQTDSAKSVRKVKTVLDKKSTEEYCVQQVGTLVTHTFFSLFSWALRQSIIGRIGRHVNKSWQLVVHSAMTT